MKHIHSSRPADLSTQVTLAERQVLMRRRAIRMRADGLRHALHEQLGDPKLLLWAAGVGFAAGEVLNARDTGATGHSIRPAAAQEATVASLLERALKWTAMARTVAGLFDSQQPPTATDG